MPSKPAKYGIKFWLLCDADNYFVVNMQPYLGKEGDHPEVKQGSRVVKDLVQHLHGSGRNITTDNFFTDLQLAQDLLQNKLTLLGTVRANRKFIPKDFLPHPQRAINSSLFWFHARYYVGLMDS